VTKEDAFCKASLQLVVEYFYDMSNINEKLSSFHSLHQRKRNKSPPILST